MPPREPSLSPDLLESVTHNVLLASVCESLQSFLGCIVCGQVSRFITCYARPPDNAETDPGGLPKVDPKLLREGFSILAQELDNSSGTAIINNLEGTRWSSIFYQVLLTRIIHDNECIGTLCVANRFQDYTSRDAETLRRIACSVGTFLSQDPQCQAIRNFHQLESKYENLEREYQSIETVLHEQLAERVESEVSLHRLEVQIREILDNTPAVVYVKDLQGRYEFINRRFEELFSITRREIVGRIDTEIFPRPLAEEFMKHDRQVAETGETLKTDEIAPHEDGYHTYFTTKFPIRDHQGKVRAVAGISTDITDRVRAEEQVESLSRRLSLILDSVGDGVCGLDQSGKITFMNSTAQAMLEWEEQELLGQRFHEVVLRRPVKESSFPVLKFPIDIDGITPIQFLEEEETFQTKSGRILPVEYVCSPIQEKKRVTGAVISFRDISDRLARRDSERRQARTELEFRAIQYLQSGLIPDQAPKIEGYEIAGKNFAAGIASGDFFDYILRDDGSLVVVVADACGHDLAASVQMVETHALLHAFLEFDMPVSELLSRLNRTMARNLRGRFVTLFLALLRPESNRIEFAGAGHDAMILRASGKVERLKSTGLVLGVTHTFEQMDLQTVCLNSGDLVLLSTDGLQEAISPQGELYGRRRIIESLRNCQSELQSRHPPLQELVECVCQRSFEYSQTETPGDDVTAVMIHKL